MQIKDFFSLSMSIQCIFQLIFFLVLVRLLSKNTSSLSMTRNAVWCLSNLCRGKNPPPDFAKVRMFYSGTFLCQLEHGITNICH